METKRRETPLWLWPNLLSLDAPLVALVWVEILAKAFRVQSMQWESRILIGLIVWVIYVLDRLFDARKARGDSQASWLRKRHEFHQRHFSKFVVGIVAALLCSGWILLFRVGPAMAKLGVEPLLMTLIYFFLASMRRPEGTVEYLKNLVAGFTFAVGVAVPVCYHAGVHDLARLIFNQPVLYFGILATLNITAIDLWEHAALATEEEERDASELALSLPLILLAGIAFYSGIKAPQETLRWSCYAVFLSSALLQVLNRLRKRLSIDALRVGADLALIVPYLIVVSAP